jgi:hypothetical protein
LAKSLSEKCPSVKRFLTKRPKAKNICWLNVYLQNVHQLNVFLPKKKNCILLVRLLLAKCPSAEWFFVKRHWAKCLVAKLPLAKYESVKKFSTKKLEPNVWPNMYFGRMSVVQMFFWPKEVKPTRKAYRFIDEIMLSV